MVSWYALIINKMDILFNCPLIYPPEGYTESDIGGRVTPPSTRKNKKDPAQRARLWSGDLLANGNGTKKSKKWKKGAENPEKFKKSKKTATVGGKNGILLPYCCRYCCHLKALILLYFFYLATELTKK